MNTVSKSPNTLEPAEPSAAVVDLDSGSEEESQLHGTDTPTSCYSGTPPKKNNRRKCKLLIRNDDNITFESASASAKNEENKKNQPSSLTKKVAGGKNNTTKEPMAKTVGQPAAEPGPSTVPTRTQTLKQMMSENPNFESMQRVAFLRACVNYMLKVKNLRTIDFDSMETVTLSKLVNTYNGITRVPNDNEDVIGLSESDEDN